MFTKSSLRKLWDNTRLCITRKMKTCTPSHTHTSKEAIHSNAEPTISQIRDREKAGKTRAEQYSQKTETDWGLGATEMTRTDKVEFQTLSHWSCRGVVQDIRSCTCEWMLWNLRASGIHTLLQRDSLWSVQGSREPPTVSRTDQNFLWLQMKWTPHT